MSSMSYESHKSQKELNYQLLTGLKKHLSIAANTSLSKNERLNSLSNVEEVLNYVVLHLNEALSADEIAILSRFFQKLLVKVVKAKILIHSKPESFNDEIGFINIMLQV